MSNKTIVEFGFLMMWIIMQISEDVIHRGWNPTRACHSKRETWVVSHAINWPSRAIVKESQRTTELDTNVVQKPNIRDGKKVSNSLMNRSRSIVIYNVTLFRMTPVAP